MARHHHLVPQMYLRRFADGEDKLRVVSRRSPHGGHVSTVNNACNEVGFYEIPAAELREPHAGGLEGDPEMVEKLFSEIEGAAKPVIDSVLAGSFPPAVEDRTSLATFAAIQMTRSWTFRHRTQQMNNIVGPDLLQIGITDARIRDWLQSRGEPAGARAIRAFRERMAAEPASFELSRGYLVANSLRMAVEEFLPRLLARPWRLLRFGDNVLITSDHPVGLWSPDPSRPLGVGTAAMIYLPLDRCTALAFSSSGLEKESSAGAVRARQVNQSVARNAHRWIFHHPLDAPLGSFDVPAVEQLATEIVATRPGPEGGVWELHRMFSRPDEKL